MEVYLVPVGREEHELYCEVPDDEPPASGSAQQPGFIRSLVHRFRETLAAAERERRDRLAGRHTEEPNGWVGRIKARTLRWAAEAIAEQRLLWKLRRCDSATLGFPEDLTSDAARGLLQDQLGRDYDKHRRWLVLNFLGLIASAPLMFVPGPNVLAYYFAFRIVGHFFSVRGARQGLDVTTWALQPRAELRELREVVASEGPARHARLREIEARLRLDHLVAFVERVTGR
jgi:hypothetical protein